MGYAKPNQESQQEDKAQTLAKENTETPEWEPWKVPSWRAVHTK